MITDNGNWVMKHWNKKKKKKRKGGETGLGRDFKELKITTVMVKWEIFFSAWGTRKTVINARTPWSGYPPQRLHEELSDAAWVQKGSWSIAELFDALRQPKSTAGLAVREAAVLENVTYIEASASQAAVRGISSLYSHGHFLKYL